MILSIISVLNSLVLVPIVVIGDILHKLGFLEKAFNCYKFSFDHFKYEGYQYFKVMLIRKLAKIHYQYDDYGSVVYYYQLLIRITDYKELTSVELFEMGWSLYELAELDAAKKYFNVIIDLAEHTDDKLSLANGFNALGVIDYAQGYYESSIQNYENSLDTYGSTSLSRAKDKVQNLINLGASFLALARFDEAENYYLRALNEKLDISKENKLLIATARNNLGEIYRKVNKFDEALEQYELALPNQLEVAGEYSVDVSTTRNNIGLIHFHLGEYEQALDQLNAALKINIELRDEGHPDISGNYHNLGAICEELSDDGSAIKYYEQAIESDMLVLGEDHPDVATTRNNLAVLLKGNSQCDLALKTIKLALASDINNFGEKHPAVARDWATLASIYSSLSRFEESVELFLNAIKSDIENYGADNISLAQKYNNVAFVYHKMNMPNEAIKHFSNAYQIFKNVLGEEHPNTKDVTDNLNTIIESAKDQVH